MTSDYFKMIKNVLKLLSIFLPLMIVAAQCISTSELSSQPTPVIKGRPGLIYYSERENSDGILAGELYLMDLETGNERALTEGALIDGSSGFSWSPIKRQIIYTEGTGMNDRELYLLGLNGQKVRLTDNNVEDKIGVWSPDEENIAFFSRWRDDNILNTYIMAHDGSGVRPVIENEAILGRDFAWSPDSKYLAISTLPVSEWHESQPPTLEEYNLQIMDVKTGELALDLSDERVRAIFSWSYAGDKLVYLSDVTMVSPYTPLYSTMYTLDILTAHEAQIASFEQIGDPLWSPVKDVIAFVASKDSIPTSSQEIDDFERNIYLIHAEGTGLTQLTDGGVWGIGSWSPDGRRLVVTSLGKDSVESEIYILDIESKELEQITNNNVFDAFPIWVEY